MATKDENLKFYEAMREVPKEAQKSFNNGRFSGTDINPMWRIKKLTEVYGPAGHGWYTEVVSREITKAEDGTECAFVAINLFTCVNGEWSKPIYGEGGNTFVTKTKSGTLFVSDEAYKMAYTDALSNACKALGVGADIWFANDKEHSTKYDQQTELAKAQPPKAHPATSTPQQASGKLPASDGEPKTQPLGNVIIFVRSASTQKELKDIYEKYTDYQSDERFIKELRERKESLLANGINK